MRLTIAVVAVLLLAVLAFVYMQPSSSPKRLAAVPAILRRYTGGDHRGDHREADTTTSEDTPAIVHHHDEFFTPLRSLGL